MKALILVILFSVITFFSFSQTVLMGGANQTICGGDFYDSGGSGSDFSSDEDSQLTITPSLPGNKLQVTFTAWDFGGTTFDWLEIYNGNSSASPLIGIYNGTTQITLNAPIQSSASDGSLTFENDRGSIHKIAAKINNTTTFNGWDYWHYEDSKKKLIAGQPPRGFILNLARSIFILSEQLTCPG